MRRTAIAALLVGGLLVTACGDDDARPPTPLLTPAPTGRPTPAGGDGAAPRHHVTGVLTVATGEPAFEPWVDRRRTRDPGEGFEAAVAYAVAGEMGFTDDQVTWVRTTFDEAIQPGAKNFDFNLQQYSITPERAETISFSDPVLLEQPGDRRPRGLAGRGRHHGGRPEGRQVRRPGRHDEPDIHHRRHPARRRAVRVRRQRRRQGGARGRPDRRDRGRPADGVVHARRSRSRAAASSASSPPRPAAPPTTSGWCSRRTTRSSSAPTPRWPRSRDSGELRRDHRPVAA